MTYVGNVDNFPVAQKLGDKVLGMQVCSKRVPNPKNKDIRVRLEHLSCTK